MSKIYIVINGHEPGIYEDWDKCKSQIDGFSNAKYKSFKNIKDLLIGTDEYSLFYQEYFNKVRNVTRLAEPPKESPSRMIQNSTSGVVPPSIIDTLKKIENTVSSVKGINNSFSTPYTNFPYEINSIAVDGACSGNPGIGEYQCVEVSNNETIFLVSNFENTSNNVMEFLALVDAIKYTYDLDESERKIIYSDSVTAMAWVRNKEVKSTINTPESKLAMTNAVNWLKNHNIKTITPLIKKWNTKEWGEIPADFGRK